ncbi:phage regulatory protein, rha family [Clostridium magnum DSM 2767]|nr:phage regulatory protein, rha family [Clostridium magnum DSM 2767]
MGSRIIAEKFEKRHDQVLRDIENLMEGLHKIEDTHIDNYFIKSSYVHEQNNQRYKEYLLTRDGFSLLVMGFTGKKALEWKLKYIEAFNKMELFIREKLSSEWKETRIKGKLARRNETDIIMTDLIPLAISQGSKNAGKLYITYSKLVNDCVGIPAKSRDKATRRVLDVIYNLENLIEHVISEEVGKGTYYKDIYKICKTKCYQLAELCYLPQQRLIS